MVMRRPVSVMRHHAPLFDASQRRVTQKHWAFFRSLRARLRQPWMRRGWRGQISQRYTRLICAMPDRECALQSRSCRRNLKPVALRKWGTGLMRCTSSCLHLRWTPSASSIRCVLLSRVVKVQRKHRCLSAVTVIHLQPGMHSPRCTTMVNTTMQ